MHLTAHSTHTIKSQNFHHAPLKISFHPMTMFAYRFLFFVGTIHFLLKYLAYAM